MDKITPPRSTCAVSVIIPIYNAEKYISICLESILFQTLQNFEVIVVDDGSTDSSAAIVQSYIPKFGGRLTFAKMKSNTGSGAMPRNKGFSFSRGEYVFFMDADDVIIETALEEMYTLAKDYSADVVYCERYFKSEGEGEDFINNVCICTLKYKTQSPPFVDKPTFETENIKERVKGIWKDRFLVTPWCKLVRRDLMIENEIFFPHVKISEDDIWSYGLVFYAKKFLRVPNIVYVHRYHDSSIMTIKRTPQQKVNFWISPVILGLKALDNLMSRHEFFQQNLEYRYAFLEKFVHKKLETVFHDTLQIPQVSIYEAIKDKFGDKLGEYDVLIPVLITLINTQQKNLKIEQTRFNELANFAIQAQRRINELEAQLKIK